MRYLPLIVVLACRACGWRFVTSYTPGDLITDVRVPCPSCKAPVSKRSDRIDQIDNPD